MLNFFKNFGKGVLYVLVLPFLVAGMALYGVFALFVFIFLAIKGLILFFTGRSLYEDLPEDKEAKKRIAIANGQYVPEEPVAKIQEEIIKDKEEPAKVENDPFYIPDYLKTDEDRQLVNQKDETPLEQFLEEKKQEPVPPEPQIEPAFEQEQVVQEEPKEEIIMQKSTQNSAFLEINEDDDHDDDDDSGVKIDFE